MRLLRTRRRIPEPSIQEQIAPLLLREPDYTTPDGGLRLWHLDGVEWMNAPVPPPSHRCRVQTLGRDRGRFGAPHAVIRCACGNIGWTDLGWSDGRDRNSRVAALEGSSSS